MASLEVGSQFTEKSSLSRGEAPAGLQQPNP